MLWKASKALLQQPSPGDLIYCTNPAAWHCVWRWIIVTGDAEWSPHVFTIPPILPSIYSGFSMVLPFFASPFRYCLVHGPILQVGSLSCW
jgi:hypothetical protein